MIGLVFATFAVSLVVFLLWTSAKGRSAKRQRASNARDYSHLLAEEPPLSPHEWRPLAGDDATARALLPPFVLKFLVELRALKCEIESPDATTVEGADFRVFGLRSTNPGDESHASCATCVAFGIPAECPMLSVHPDVDGMNVSSALFRMESDDFNRSFAIDCEDRRFAFGLIDAAMMEWMLAAPKHAYLAVIGSDVLIQLEHPCGEPIDYEAALGFAVGLRKRIPDIVYSEYASK